MGIFILRFYGPTGKFKRPKIWSRRLRSRRILFASNQHQDEASKNPNAKILHPSILLEECDQRKIQRQKINRKVHNVVSKFASRFPVFFDFHHGGAQS